MHTGLMSKYAARDAAFAFASHLQFSGASNLRGEWGPVCKSGLNPHPATETSRYWF